MPSNCNMCNSINTQLKPVVDEVICLSCGHVQPPSIIELSELIDKVDGAEPNSIHGSTTVGKCTLLVVHGVVKQ